MSVLMRRPLVIHTQHQSSVSPQCTHWKSKYSSHHFMGLFSELTLTLHNLQWVRKVQFLKYGLILVAAIFRPLPSQHTQLSPPPPHTHTHTHPHSTLNYPHPLHTHTHTHTPSQHTQLSPPPPRSSGHW